MDTKASALTANHFFDGRIKVTRKLWNKNDAAILSIENKT